MLSEGSRERGMVEGSLAREPMPSAVPPERDRNSVVQPPILEYPQTTPSRAGASLHSTASHWIALWARTRCEQMVYDHLLSRGFRAFLPMLDVWLRRQGTRYRAAVPMFPGYLFLNHRIDKRSYIEVSNTRGLIQILGGCWDSLATIPDQEMEAIERLHRTRAHVRPHPYLREGQRVRIVQGVLAGLEGILLQTEGDRGRLVVSVNLLQRSVAVEIDCSLVEPTGDGSSYACAQLPHASMPLALQQETATISADPGLVRR